MDSRKFIIQNKDDEMKMKIGKLNIVEYVDHLYMGVLLNHEQHAKVLKLLSNDEKVTVWGYVKLKRQIDLDHIYFGKKGDLVIIFTRIGVLPEKLKSLFPKYSKLYNEKRTFWYETLSYEGYERLFRKITFEKAELGYDVEIYHEFNSLSSTFTEEQNRRYEAFIKLEKMTKERDEKLKIIYNKLVKKYSNFTKKQLLDYFKEKKYSDYRKSASKEDLVSFVSRLEGFNIELGKVFDFKTFYSLSDSMKLKE